MENFIYKRDYTSKWDEEDPSTAAFWDELGSNGFIKDMHDYRMQAPQIVVPAVKRQFDLVLKQADEMAEEFGGVVHGEVNYQDYRAFIRLTVPIFAADSAGTMEFMVSALAYSDNFNIDTAADGKNILISIGFHYFTELHTAQEAEAFAVKASEKLRAAHAAAERQLENMND